MVVENLKEKEVISKPIEQEENKKIKKSWKSYAMHILLIVFALIPLIFSMKYLNDVKKIYSFDNLRFTILTLAIWICEYLILKGITNKTKVSISIVVGVEVIYDIINYVVRTVRGAAITISDLVAIKTALSVSKNIEFNFDNKFFLGIVFVVLSIAILIIFRKRFVTEKNNCKLRITKVVIGIIVIFILSKTNIYTKYSLWDINENYRILGTPTTILRMVHNFKVQPPKGYDKIETQKLLDSYNISIKNEEEKANIIVIINESFCDYYNLYKKAYADPIEYFTELSKSENVISGKMYSSEFGGQTANVEYEFLTQNSTRILPTGSYVFQQYITRDVKSSLVENLKSQGYKTSAMHPWESYAYSRNKIYRLFGFDSIKFKDDIEGLEENFNNEFFSDRSTYKELLKEMKEKDKNEKLFEYVLTVQNHIGYTNPDPRQRTYSEDNEENVYMQLIHESAEALKEVIQELEKSDEKYVLLFFGDHQPNLDYSDTSIERSIEQYEVPFIIWANYDIKEQYNVQTSTIFLQNYLLKAAGVKYSEMNNYMQELQKYYPVITKKFYIDKNGNMLKTENDESECYEKLEEYNKIDYYRIFEEK